MALLAILLLVLPILVLMAVNPSFPGTWWWNTRDYARWNTIDHIADRRFGRDYTTAEITAMASTEHWIGLGTAQNGLTLLNKASRVPREDTTPRQVLDISPGPGQDDFLMLDGHQAISHVTPRQSGSSLVEPWLPKPMYRVWPTSSPWQQTSIIANQLDMHGWLMAVAGQGVARYTFDRFPSGELYRTRSWQTSTLSAIPLEQALMTDNGIWITLKGGGIRYAERTALAEQPRRSVNTPPIRHLDAGHDGQWAMATDAQSGVWLYHHKNEDWLGPFFGTTPCTLHSPENVTMARVQGHMLWLGSRKGFFAYDSDARRLHCVLPDVEVLDIALLESADATSPVQRVLVGSNTGLALVSSPEATTEGTFAIKQLDSDPVISMSVSPDGTLCVYHVRIAVQGKPAEYEVRAFENPFTGGTRTTLLPRQGWQLSETPPAITGIERIGQQLLIATSAGAFFYDPATHTYEDRSTSRFIQEVEQKRIEHDVTLRNFSSLRQGTNILAIADSNPQFLRKEDARGEKKWVSLDPLRRTKPLQITEAGERILGLGQEGDLYWYRYPEWPLVKDYLTGKAQSLEAFPPLNTGVHGDVLHTGDKWKLAFLNRNWLITYDSEDGKMSEKRLPDAGQSTITQLRFVGDRFVYLHDSGKIVAEDGQGIFGHGHLPFAPTQVTTLAPSLDAETILLGGPTGQAMKYAWSSGSWTTVGPGPIPGNNAGRDIVALQETKNGTFAKVVDGTLLHTYNDAWTVLPRYSQWSTDSSGARVWVVAQDGVARITPQKSKPVSEWAESQYSAGTGMRAFVARASFAWQKDETTVVHCIAGSPQVGIYDARTDTWKELKLDGLSAPRHFTASAQSLIVLDGHRILRIDKDLKVQPLTTLPSDTTKVSVHTKNNSLQVAFVHQNALGLKRWAKIEDKAEEYQRGGAMMPTDFDPAKVVYVAPYGDTAIVLVDERGRCVTYNYLSGQWSTLREATQGEVVYGWFSSTTKDTAHVLLKTARQTTVVVSVSNGRVDKDYKIAASPEALQTFVARLGRAFTSVEYPKERVLEKPVRILRQRTGTTYEPALQRDLAGGNRFEPAHVVYAQPRGAAMLLVDDVGGCARYDSGACRGMMPCFLVRFWQWITGTHDYTTGQWTILRPATPGQTVYGWLAATPGDASHLLLSTDQQTTVVVPLPEQDVGSGNTEYTIALPPKVLQDVVSHLDLAKHSVALERPGDRTLLATKMVRVVREQQQTKYQFSLHDTWHTMHPQGSWFAEDIVEDIAFSEAGHLWVLQGSKLVHVAPMSGSNGLAPTLHTFALSQATTALETLPSGHILLRYGDRTSAMLEEDRNEVKLIGPIAGWPLATLNLAGYQLDWMWRPNGPLEVVWRKASFPVWATMGDRLATQSVHDLALTDTGLLLATDLGLLVRDPSTYALRAVYPDITDVRFVRLYGPERLLLQVGRTLAFAWQEGKPVALSEREPSASRSTIESGPWSWQFQYLHRGQTPLEIVHRADKHRRGWSQTTTGQWQCHDDLVHWIARNVSGKELWLATQDGLWAFDPQKGRSTVPSALLEGRNVTKVLLPSSGPWWWQDASQQWHHIPPPNRPVSQDATSPPLPTEEFSFNNAAITISYFAGLLTFRPADGNARTVFKRGRFFFDNGEQIVGDNKALYVFVPERGIVQRNPTNPTEVLRFWPLPSAFLPAPYVLKLSPKGMRLETDSADTQRKHGWELDLHHGDGQWAPWEGPVEERTDIAIGPIVWRPRRQGTLRLEPFVLQKPGAPQRLQDWWSEDRFAWDKALAVGALNHGVAVVVSPAGPVALQSRDHKPFYPVALWPLARLTSCAIVREEGRAIGLALGGARTPPQYLITTDPQGAPEIMAGSVRPFGLSQAVVSLDYMGIPNDRFIGFSQAWVPYDASEAQNTKGVLVSHLPRFDTKVLLKDGQFIFDRVDRASPVSTAAHSGTAEGRTWVLSSMCQGPSDPACVLGLNQLARERSTGRTRLMLRDLWPTVIERASVSFHALRPTEEGAFVGLYQRTLAEKVTWNVSRGMITDQGLTWNPTDFRDVKELFRLGDNVNLDVARLRWTSQATYVGDEGTPFTISPLDYKLFVSESGGMAFAFDVLTSLTIDKEHKNLAVGTRGGVFLCPCQSSGSPLLALAHPDWSFTFNQPLASRHWVTEVTRARHDIDGVLWVKFGLTGQTAQLRDTFHWDIGTAAWPMVYGRARQATVNIDGTGLKAHNRLYESSNDAWGMGRKPLHKVVDVAFDDKTNALWIATRNMGVFKVLPERLPR